MWVRQVDAERTQVFTALVEKIGGLVEAELDRLFDPVEQALQRTRLRGLQGVIRIDDVPGMNAAFMPLLETTQSLSGALVANDKGAEYFLRRDGNSWITRLTVASEAGRVATMQRWQNEGALEDTWQEKGPYDPRKRPWFTGALEHGTGETVYWTSPYRFYSSHRAGVTASVAWRDPKSKVMTVAALDVLLDTLAKMVAGITVADRGSAFIVTDENQVLGVGGSGNDADLTLLSRLSRGPHLAAAFEDWLADGRPLTPFRVDTAAFGVWWSQFRPYSLGSRTLWVGLVVPEEDLIKRAGGASMAVPVALAGAGILVCGLSIWLIRRFAPALTRSRRGFGALPVENVRELLAGGENEQLEFKSTVRWNLQAGKPGKEMELAWLKTVVAFLNSKGGVIVLGVADDGTPVGLAKDNFANDDKCLRHVDNLLDQHVGAAFLPYVSVRLESVDELKVVVIVCQPSPQPAFLRSGNSEDFYIRSGPGTRKLPASQIMSYMQTRTAE